jgi:hypothetical protein
MEPAACIFRIKDFAGHQIKVVNAETLRKR